MTYTDDVPEFPEFPDDGPDFSEVLAELREAQGWNDDTMLMLALEFIRDEHKEIEFLDMLRAQVAYENTEGVPE